MKPAHSVHRGTLFGLLILLSSATAPALAGPSITVDADTGRVLSQEDAYQRWYPASLTKLMTTYVTFRAIQAGELTLQSPVDFSARATREPPSKMGYPQGSEITVDNAIKILMVKSANDVATALGETVGGSQGAFAARMNKEAARLGMTGSHFINAHGLHSVEQYTTARDMAILALALKRDFPQYASYFNIGALQQGETIIPNHNEVIGRFDGGNGMKTGYTCAAGFNLVASADRGNRHLVTVVLGALSPDARGYRTAELLTQGFANQNPNAPTLADLPKSGTDLNMPGNMRSSICTDEAQKQIAKTRDANGRPLTPSPYLTEKAADTVPVMISLGGATGPRSTQPRFADVPTPTPRPDYTPTVSANAKIRQDG